MSDSSGLISNKSRSPSFSHDNCTIIEYEDLDASSSSGFSWRKTEDAETSSFSETSEEEASPASDEDLNDLKVSVKDSFILMLGFLNKIEEYLTENELNEELKLLKLVLINSAESFGYNVIRTRHNGEIAKKAKTSKQTRKTDTILKQTPPKKMKRGAEINSDTDKRPKRNSIRIKNIEKNVKNTPVEKTEQKRQSKKRKIESSPCGDDRRVSKRVKHNVSSDRVSFIATKLKQALSPIKELSRTSDLNATPTIQGTSDDSNDTSSPSGHKVGKEAPKRGGKQSKLLRNPSKKSERRKLYCSETWLDKLSSSGVI